MTKHYVLKNSRWVRVYRCGYDTFIFKGDNVIYKFDDFECKSKII